jgi:transcriptional regulator with XRE-family HTH domain
LSIGKANLFSINFKKIMYTLSTRLAEALDGPPKRSQLELSIACGVSAPSVNDWLSGKTKSVRSQYLLKAAKFLNVRFEWLATGLGNKYEPLAVREDQAIYNVRPWNKDHPNLLPMLSKLNEANLNKLSEFAEFMLEKQDGQSKN